MRRLILLVSVVCFAVGLGITVRAQDTVPTLPLAFIRDNEEAIYLSGFADDVLVIPAPEPIIWKPLVWSADGQQLFFFARGTMGYRIYATDTRGVPPIEVDNGVAVWSPISANDDGLLYLIPDFDVPLHIDMTFYDGRTFIAPIQYDVYQLAPDATEPQRLGGFVYDVECQGGTEHRAAALYSSETGWRERRQILAITPYGVVHSMMCAGAGTGLLNLDTGESTLLGINLGSAVVSDDGESVLGIDDGVLTRFTLATGESRAIDTAEVPALVVWSADDPDTVFYTTQRRIDEIIIEDETDIQRLRDASQFGRRFTVNHASVRRLNLQTGEDVELYAADVYGIGRLIPTPDGRYLLFSEVPNIDVWLETVLTSTDDADATREAANLTVQVNVYLLNFDTGEVTTIGTNMEQAALNIPAYLEANP